MDWPKNDFSRSDKANWADRRNYNIIVWWFFSYEISNNENSVLWSESWIVAYGHSDWPYLDNTWDLLDIFLNDVIFLSMKI